jgi:hypothetical protein
MNGLQCSMLNAGMLNAQWGMLNVEH